jgi:hypothetical protein
MDTKTSGQPFPVDTPDTTTDTSKTMSERKDESKLTFKETLTNTSKKTDVTPLDIFDTHLVESILEGFNDVQKLAKEAGSSRNSDEEKYQIKLAMEKQLSELEVFIREQGRKRTNLNNKNTYSPETVKRTINEIIKLLREPFKDYLLASNLNCPSGFWTRDPSMHFAGLIPNLKKLKKSVEFDAKFATLVYGPEKTGKSELINWFANEYANMKTWYVIEKDYPKNKTSNKRVTTKLRDINQEPIDPSHIIVLNTTKNKSQDKQYYRFYKAQDLDYSDYYGSIKSCMTNSGSNGNRVNILIADRLASLNDQPKFWNALKKLKDEGHGDHFRFIGVIQDPKELKDEYLSIFDARIFVDYLNKTARLNLIKSLVPPEWNLFRYLRDTFYWDDQETKNNPFESSTREIAMETLSEYSRNKISNTKQEENVKEINKEALDKFNLIEVLERALERLAEISGAQTDLLLCSMRNYGFPVDSIKTKNSGKTESGHSRLAGMNIDDLQHLVKDFFNDLNDYFEVKWDKKVAFKPDWIYIGAFGPNYMKNVRYSDPEYGKFLKAQTQFFNDILTHFEKQNSVSKANDAFVEFVSYSINELRKKYQNTWKSPSYEKYLKIFAYYLTNDDVDENHEPIEKSNLTSQQFVIQLKDLKSSKCLLNSNGHNVILHGPNNWT